MAITYSHSNKNMHNFVKKMQNPEMSTVMPSLGLSKMQECKDSGVFLNLSSGHLDPKSGIRYTAKQKGHSVEVFYIPNARRNMNLNKVLTCDRRVCSSRICKIPWGFAATRSRHNSEGLLDTGLQRRFSWVYSS